MYTTLESRLQRLVASGEAACLAESLIGLEKESLRVAAEGGISQAQHPQALGSPLTNPYITTDFSEALVELITPPCGSIQDALDFLHDIQTFVYSKLGNETLWATSMPCVVESGASIPIAQYGSSNAGTMKTVYRRGLGYRYGRTMQVIAGVHFNYSLSQDFWRHYQQQEGNQRPLKDFIAAEYMALVRNMLRYGWMIPYLFGASPAICKSFLHGKPSILSEFNENTFYEPYATSLRMGDIGYTNNQEDMAGIKANYNSIGEYVSSLQAAIARPYEGYSDIGVKVDGEYRQLNDNILQIENEYYSTVRPKQVLQGNEKPTSALRDRGVAYVEIRSIDVNAFDPLGVNAEQLYFLETFVLFCLLQESPLLSEMEMNEIDMNLIQVAHFGRQPGISLSRDDEYIALKDWALELCDAMRPIAQLLDEVNATGAYSGSLDKQVECVLDPDNTPSARMLAEMREYGEGFFHYAKRMSMQHYMHFSASRLPPERLALFQQAASDSWQQQRQIEAADDIDFDEFLRRYFAQE